MTPTYYSFTRELLEDESYSYSFLTDHNIIYLVEFNIRLYEELYDYFPNLLKNGYGLGFYCKKFNENERKICDQRVSLTIIKIIQDHFDLLGNDSVLLYHCDNSDNRQRTRDLLFNSWYKKYNLSGSFIKEALEVELVDENKKIRPYYIGFITSKNNSKLSILKDEFEDFATRMVTAEIEKNNNGI